MISFVCMNLWSALYQHFQLHSVLGSLLSVCFIRMPAFLTNSISCALLFIIGLFLRFGIFITFCGGGGCSFFSIWHNYVLMIITCISQLSISLPEC